MLCNRFVFPFRLSHRATAYGRAILLWEFCLSVRLSHAGIVSKRLNVSSCFVMHAVDQSFWFSEPNWRFKFQTKKLVLVMVPASSSDEGLRWRPKRQGSKNNWLCFDEFLI